MRKIRRTSSEPPEVHAFAASDRRRSAACTRPAQPLPVHATQPSPCRSTPQSPKPHDARPPTRAPDTGIPHAGPGSASVHPQASQPCCPCTGACHRDGSKQATSSLPPLPSTAEARPAAAVSPRTSRWKADDAWLQGIRVYDRTTQGPSCFTRHSHRQHEQRTRVRRKRLLYACPLAQRPVVPHVVDEPAPAAQQRVDRAKPAIHR